MYTNYNYRPGDNDQPIWLNEIDCTKSTFYCLFKCARCTLHSYKDKCTHTEDVTLICSKHMCYYTNSIIIYCYHSGASQGTGTNVTLGYCEGTLK